jgi:malonate-semialdehyde dehydrogenase (acetylating)/methylmalonate-semialdehyde dehydrogenase
VQNLDEAINLVNANRYGDGAAIFTRDGAAVRRLHSEAQAEMIGINVPIPVPVGFYNFGGRGESLFEDRHIYGPEASSFYTRGKVVTSRSPSPVAGVSLAVPSG